MGIDSRVPPGKKRENYALPGDPGYRGIGPPEGEPDAKEVFLGSQAPDPEDKKLGGEEGAGDLEEVKRRKKAAEASRGASEKALGGTAGAAEGLRDKGINIGEIGRVSLREQQAAMRQQQMGLLMQAFGHGGGPGQEAAQAGLTAQDQAMSSAGAGAGLMGRGGIAAQRQVGRAQDQLGLQGQSVLEQAGLEDQMNAQNLLGQQIGQMQQQGLQMGETGNQGALGNLGLQGSANRQMLAQDQQREGALNADELTRLGLDLESQTRLQEMMAKRKPNQGFLGGVMNSIGGMMASIGGGMGDKKGSE